MPGSQNEPTERVRCPVHGFIRYSRNERKVIDHSVFQRLRNVRQLAMEYLVYPGATHTRFEHSLGVMDMASRVFDMLLRLHRDDIESELKPVPELAEIRYRKPDNLFAFTGCCTTLVTLHSRTPENREYPEDKNTKLFPFM